MELFNPKSNINFMAVRKWSVWVSVALMLIAIGALATRGLNYALDFTGGTMVEVEFAEPTEVQQVRSALSAGGFGDAMVQSFGSRAVAIRLPPRTSKEDNEQLGVRVVEVLQGAGLKASLERSEFVGPQVGEELANNGVIALLLVMAGILVYVALRFEWRFAVAAVACQFHDVILVAGFFALTGLEFDLTVLAALLAVLGYSINDTIVVFDRIRENFMLAKKIDTVELLNRSINTTLSRTIMTSGSTLITVFALYFLGGPVLENFSIALILGIVIGTLSSIWFASPLLLMMGVSKRDLMRRVEEDPRLAARP